MRGSRRALLAVGVVAVICLLGQSADGESHQPASSSDQAAAERVLGPQWKELARRAGMIFSATVLSTTAPTGTRTDHTVPAVELILRVDRAVAGVEPGQILTIHEWAGAWSLHRPIRRGERVLLFLYPPSRRGLTSPVGGSQGLLHLDASGRNIVERTEPITPNGSRNTLLMSPQGAMRTQVGRDCITMVQLARAIRSARGE